jgi:hypothetical protein
MGEIHDNASPPDLDRRKYRRFCLRCPVLVEFSSGDSIGGLLLESPSVLPESQPLSFTLTVDGGSIVRPIKFFGEGKVVRVEPRGPGLGFTVAVECTHPITQMEDYLAGSAD